MCILIMYLIIFNFYCDKKIRKKINNGNKYNKWHSIHNYYFKYYLQ